MHSGQEMKFHDRSTRRKAQGYRLTYSPIHPEPVEGCRHQIKFKYQENKQR